MELLKREPLGVAARLLVPLPHRGRIRRSELAIAQRGRLSRLTCYFSSSSPSLARRKLGDIFDKHRDADDPEKAITIEGTMSYCEDLSTSLEDVVLLPLSFYLQSPTMGRFTRDKFISGWRTLADGTKACDTIEGQKKALKVLKKELVKDAPVKGELGASSTAGLFKRTYEFTYGFAKPEGQKSLREQPHAVGRMR